MLARVPTANVVEARAIAAVVVLETHRTVGAADLRTAVPVLVAVEVAAIGVLLAGATLRATLGAAAKAAAAVVLAALRVLFAFIAVGRAREAPTEALDAVGVAAFDGGVAGNTVRQADLLGLTKLVFAEQRLAAAGVARAEIAERCASRERYEVIVAGARSAGANVHGHDG